MATKLSRRTVLGTAGALAGSTALGLTTASGEGEAPRIELRLLETSDLHMFVLDWDYYHAKLDPTVGFSNVATLIRKARSEAANTLLFDNGDFLQGNPLADYVAHQPAPSAANIHPIIALMTDLGYDAIGLGNHEFNYGLEFLENTLAGAPFPVVCANVARAGGAPFLPPHAILTRTLKDTAGSEQQLRIGVIGFVPPQIMMWDKARLDGKLETSDIVLAAKKLVPELRAKCDVLVALCHAGINADPWVEGMENAALHLAAVPGFDLILTGHSHRVFPGPKYAGREGVDAVAGRLNGVPAIMPGFWGSHLGLADLTLKRDGDRWSVEKASVETRPIYKRDQGKVEPLAARDAAVAARIMSAHDATVAWVEEPVGSTDGPLHSYFCWAGFDPPTALVNAAQTWYARPLLAGTPFAGLPLLSSSSLFRAGYTPDSFIDIAPGKTSLRQVADLYIYSSNAVTALKVTGAQIHEWLEYSARAFNTIDPAQTAPQALVDKRIPSYNFDIISGLEYRIDVTRPARYDGKGQLSAQNRRILDLRFEGAPIDPAREFVVVTNNHRADSRGSIAALAACPIVLRAPDTNQDAVVRYFKSQPTVAAQHAFPWSFAQTGRPATVYFDSGMAAPDHIAGRPGLALLGPGEPGYTRIGLTLA